MKTVFPPAIYLLCLLTYYSCQKTNMLQMENAAVNTGSLATDVAAIYPFGVSRLFGDNMVIQRDKPASVWGTAPAGKTLYIKASWINNTDTAIAGKNNQWLATLPAAPANATPQQLYITDGANTVTFSNILIGDVWICSGQSNMVMPVDSVVPPFGGFNGVVNYQQEIAAANWPLLRLISLQPDFAVKPAYDLNYPASWSSCDPNTVRAYSAVAYFFGRKIMTTLQVPVGLVVSAVNGSACQWWTNKKSVQSDPVLNAYYTGDSVSRLFNGMINPLKLMAVKGFIWYQGEANHTDQPVSNYTRLNSALIKGWRNQFGQGRLPFYFVQVAPFDYNWSNGRSNPSDNKDAFFREAQAKVRSVSNTGMAVTMDVGDVTHIHPKDKAPVGERLALLALHHVYGLAVQDVGPQYASCTFNTRTATIRFAGSSATGLTTKNNGALAQYFFVAGADSIFRQASATISDNKMLVTASPDTPLPLLSVRYAFTNFPITNLQNAAGLPMEPFRTDAWTR